MAARDAQGGTRNGPDTRRNRPCVLDQRENVNHDVGHLFASDGGARVQFETLIARARAEISGPHALLLQLLVISVDDVFHHGRNAVSGRGIGKGLTKDRAHRMAQARVTYADAVAWLTDRTSTRWGSLRYCCEHLGFDTDAVADQVAVWIAEAHPPRRRLLRPRGSGMRRRALHGQLGTFDAEERARIQAVVTAADVAGLSITELAVECGVSRETARRARAGLGPWGQVG